MEYTFNSTDVDNYNEIICPITYMGGSLQLKWYVSYMNGKASTVLLDTDDYIIINGITYYMNDIYTSLDDMPNPLNQSLLNQANLVAYKDRAGRLIIKGNEEFNISGMSRRMSYATGFHYLKNINITSSYDETNGYYIKSKAIPFLYLTPLWYIISNLGTPNQIASMTEKYKIFYPAVAVKIINTFSDGQPMCISNGDYQTISQASSMSNLKLTVVDANLEPIKFLSPIYLTICIDEVPLNESIQEAFMERAQNAAYIQQVKQHLETNNIKMSELMNKLERGLSVEPEMPVVEERKEYNQPPPLSIITHDDPAIILPDEAKQIENVSEE